MHLTVRFWPTQYMHTNTVTQSDPCCFNLRQNTTVRRTVSLPLPSFVLITQYIVGLIVDFHI